MVGLSEVETARGPSLTIAVQDGVATVDGARVISTDIAASNGVIHVIDTVVLPRDR